MDAVPKLVFTEKIDRVCRILEYNTLYVKGIIFYKSCKSCRSCQFFTFEPDFFYFFTKLPSYTWAPNWVLTW